MNYKRVKLGDIKCPYCALVCDNFKKEEHTVYGEWNNGDLAIDVKSPEGLVTGLHLLEKLHEMGYRIDNVVLSELNGGPEADILDISGNTPDKTSYIFLNKRKPVHARQVLEAYNELLIQSSKMGIKPVFPRKIKIKAATTTELEELERALIADSVPRIKRKGMNLGFMEECIPSQSLLGDINNPYNYGLYRITEKVKL